MQTDIMSGLPPHQPGPGMKEADIVRAAKWLGGAMVLSSVVLSIGLCLAAGQLPLPARTLRLEGPLEVSLRPGGGAVRHELDVRGLNR